MTVREKLIEIGYSNKEAINEIIDSLEKYYRCETEEEYIDTIEDLYNHGFELLDLEFVYNTKSDIGFYEIIQMLSRNHDGFKRRYDIGEVEDYLEYYVSITENENNNEDILDIDDYYSEEEEE